MTPTLIASIAKSPIQDYRLKTVSFIDSSLNHWQFLAAGVADRSQVIIIDRQQNGIAQITTAIQQYAEKFGSVEAIHIFSHGSPGCLYLGDRLLDSATLEQHKSDLKQWQAAEILLYGCQVAAGKTGQEFVKQLSQITGAKIAASVDLTGSQKVGATWDLEFTTASIKSSNPLSASVQENYRGKLAVITVTSVADSGAGSLRQAIKDAQNGDTIEFASSLANQTITVTSGQIEIPAGKNLTIDGSGAANLTLSGNKKSRIFLLKSTHVNPTTLTVKDLILEKGYTAERGGAIATEHQGSIVLENTEFNNNIANQGGGAIDTAFEGNLTVNNSKFDSNVATAANNERGAGAIAFHGPNNFTITNSEFTNNKGINGGAINNLNGNLTIENSRFINNETTAAFYDTGKPRAFLRGYGGAIYTDRSSSRSDDSSGTIQITNSWFEGNKGRGEGGAAYLFTGTQDNVVISGSTFKDNQILDLPNGGNSGNGGAIAQVNDAPNKGFTISDTSFVNNIAGNGGGGVWFNHAPTTITNSTFSGNKTLGQGVSSNGGGIWIGGPTDILNTTFANNHAGWVGGAIVASANQPVAVKNTIFANNTADNGPNDWQIGQHTNREITDQGGNIQWPAKLTNFFNDFNVTATITIADPKLAPLQDNGNGQLTHALLPGSAAIDAGVNRGAPTTDQNGQTRPIDGDKNGSAIVDSGAYELFVAAPEVSEIEVSESGNNIVDGTTTALDFGSTTVGTVITKTFTVQNTGNAVLNLSNLVLPTGFSLLGTVPTTVAAGSQATFEVQVDATTAGSLSGELSFTTNDSDENPFNFAVTATVSSNTTTDSGNTDSGNTDSGNTDSGNTDSGDTDSGDTDSGDTDSGDTDSGDTDSGDTDSGDTDSGDTDSGDTDSGNTDSGNTGSGLPDSVLPDSVLPDSGDPDSDSNADEDCAELPTPQLTANSVENTINGSEFDDPLIGSNIAEELKGLGGQDFLQGLSGNDNLLGGDGDDILHGNVGDDFIDGEAGNDTIYGGNDNDGLSGNIGNDFIFGNIGNDTLLGDENHDFLNGNQGNDFLDGGDGNDILFGGKDEDILKGNLGLDILFGDFGNDSLYGGDGDDFLNGNRGNDFLCGGEGNDFLFGGKDDDYLCGGDGNDFLYGDLGDDTLIGDAGNDVFALQLDHGSDTILDFELGVDDIGLAGGLTFDQLSITLNANNSLIQVNDILLATVNGVDLTVGGSDNFQLI